jgi:hypothetical protein
MKYSISVLFILLFSFDAFSQTTVNAELQVYPTGIIPGVRIEKLVTDNTSVHLRVGLNIFDHRDLGVHDEETGWGYGFTIGAARNLGDSKFSLGLRNDIWFNSVDWRDELDFSTDPDILYINGETDIIVVQPTAELTYRIETGKLVIRPSLAVGLEWNVRTVGEPTGEGPIGLIGVIVGKR